MSDFLTEQLVKRSTTNFTLLKKIGLIVATVLSTFLILGVHPMFVWVTIIMIVLDVILFQRMNIEFEYIFFNGELDIDKIINKKSRKILF